MPKILFYMQFSVLLLIILPTWATLLQEIIQMQGRRNHVLTARSSTERMKEAAYRGSRKLGFQVIAYPTRSKNAVNISSDDLS